MSQYNVTVLTVMFGTAQYQIKKLFRENLEFYFPIITLQNISLQTIIELSKKSSRKDQQCCKDIKDFFFSIYEMNYINLTKLVRGVCTLYSRQRK